MRRLVAGVGAVLMLAGCSGTEPDATAGSGSRPRVLAAFYPVAEIASRVGGDLVTVDNLTPAGTEPHDLELPPRQVERVNDADLVLYVGEGFAPAIEQAVDNRSGRSLDLTKGLALRATSEPEHHDHDHGHAHDDHGHGRESGEQDPHFWLDPTLMIGAVDAVAREMKTIVPDHAATIEANATAYKSELTALDGELRSGLATCERRVLVTSHAAFGYLAQRYGLDQHAVALSPDAEPDASTIDELSDLIEKEGVTTVFSEALVSPKVAEALARETGARTAVLDPLEGLTDRRAREGATYVTVMRENLGALRAALGCS